MPDLLSCDGSGLRAGFLEPSGFVFIVLIGYGPPVMRSTIPLRLTQRFSRIPRMIFNGKNDWPALEITMVVIIVPS